MTPFANRLNASDLIEFLVQQSITISCSQKNESTQPFGKLNSVTFLGYTVWYIAYFISIETKRSLRTTLSNKFIRYAATKKPSPLWLSGQGPCLEL